MIAGVCACGNAARYVTADGRLTCSLCPIRDRVDSIRLADVPRLLAWARDALADGTASLTDLRAILGKDISNDPQ